jgi:hypothetical protein
MSAKQVIGMEAACIILLGSMVLAIYATYRHFRGPKQADRWQIVWGGVKELTASTLKRALVFKEIFDLLT